MLHEIQKDILIQLAKKDGQRFSELCPSNIENDQFNYHLNQLIDKECIKKDDKKYYLLENGKSRILLLDSSGKEYEGLRVSVIVIVIKGSGKNKLVLAQKRNREPYAGEDGPGIAGKVRKGEKLEHAAVRKLKEETGLLGKCKFYGVLRRVVNHPNGLIDDGFFHVFLCKNPKGKLINANEYGTNRFVDVKKAIQLQRSIKRLTIKSHQIVARLVNENPISITPFYVEEFINL